MKNKNKKPKTRAYYMNVDIAMEFFKRCMDRKIDDDDVAAKEEVLAELMQENEGMMRADYDKPVEEVVKNYAKNYGKIVYVKGDKNKANEVNKLEGNPMNCPDCNMPMTLMGYGWICVNPTCENHGELVCDDPNDIENSKEE